MIEQRIASAHHDFLDFRDENGVVARILRAMQPALEVGQSAVEHRSPMGGAIKVRPRLALGVAMVLGRARVVFGNGPLALGQHIHSKPLLGMQVSVSSGALVHANQHQRRIERHGTESVGGHAVHFAFVVQRNHRDSGRKTAERAAEFCLSDDHWKAGAPAVSYGFGQSQANARISP